MINPKTNNRIRMQTVDAGTGEQVARSELVKGFEVAKGEYVLFDKEELDTMKLESTRIIDIEKFVPRASIDRLYWDTPYHLVPSGKTGIEAYAVIRAAMAKQSMVAIGRLVMSTRERICAIEIEEGALVLTTLRTAEEVRGIDQVALPELPKPDPKGNPVKSAKPANDDNKVIDLMAALRKSLESGGGRRQRAERVVADKTKPRKTGGRDAGGVTWSSLPKNSRRLCARSSLRATGLRPRRRIPRTTRRLGSNTSKRPSIISPCSPSPSRGSTRTCPRK
ncbi:MAG TPA: Ku protein [Reyranella sp.]|nr:Ku protein [Reyranella sp.]